MWEYLHQIGIIKIPANDYKTAISKVFGQMAQSMIQPEWISKDLNKTAEEQ